MKKYLFRMLIISLLVSALGSSCTSSRGKGKIKRGKPIPCPVKDC